jgi:uncharacterized protein YbcC (UPF0753/DUF2309 family)
MNTEEFSFNELEALHELKHFLPAQAPLKDFIHHNTLHAFQSSKFFDALRNASRIFGYKLSLSLEEYRELYRKGHISEEVLDRILVEKAGTDQHSQWKEKALLTSYDTSITPRIGQLRANWKILYGFDLDQHVQPLLFRVLCCYLDQGISIWNFPVHEMGFLASLREMEKNSFSSFFKTERARKHLLSGELSLSRLLDLLVGDPALYERYLFDQQFSHQGWSGIVSVIENEPQSLVDQKKISLQEVILFELLLEIDALDHKFGEIWSPLGISTKEAKPLASSIKELFAPVPETELSRVMAIWQEAYEWSYYDQVLSGIRQARQVEAPARHKSFQVALCIDDRETSLRDYLEKTDPACETFSTPGFFNVEFFFQPEHGKSYTKQCPAPVTPRYLIKELDIKGKRKTDPHFAKTTHSLFTGWLIAQTLGFWSALRLFISIFKPSVSPATSYSFAHMDQLSQLTIENKGETALENGLQVGFTIPEMAERVEGLLRSIGLTKDFAPIVYVIGHGSSSVNNPHYAAYNCGACCGRPGSVNARVFSFMANHPGVRQILATKGLPIPESTQFVGGLHDTTRDEIVFYDEEALVPENKKGHHAHTAVFNTALDLNAKERSRRFESINTNLSPAKIHKKILKRSVSLFEPRPELNHATNAICIIGRRSLTKKLFLDRRAFTNSYDYRTDPQGNILLSIMRPIGPVCGGINLEYFFSRVDNQKLGAGTKLPHNVMGLFGVANGSDGDLRPGLPSQMIEVHDPVRLLVVVEHFPEVVLSIIRSVDAVYEWYINEWVNLVTIHPESKNLFVFKHGHFVPYNPTGTTVPETPDLAPLVESSNENIPVHILN